MKKTLSFSVLLIFTTLIHAQNLGNYCGTTESPDSATVSNFPWFGNEDYITAFLDSIGYSSFGQHSQKINSSIGGLSSAVRQIPIKAWVSRTSAGLNGISNAGVNQYIRRLNEIYENANTGLAFFLKCEVGHIDNLDYYSSVDDAGQNAMMASYRDYGAINIYFIHSTTSGFVGRGLFPWGTNRNVCFLVTGDNFNDVFTLDRASVLAHEIGHVLGVLHTHHPGRSNSLIWNRDCSDCLQESVSRTRTEGPGCLPHVGKKKCTVNGDYLCDTEADPGLRDDIGFSCVDPGVNCTFNWCTGSEPHDNWNDVWMPNTTNIMSYAPEGCLQTFTPGQVAVMFTAMQQADNQSIDYANREIDAFEPDNAAFDEVDISPGNRYYHTFHWQPLANWQWNHATRLEACDEDWSRLTLVSPTSSIRISTNEVAGEAQPNTVITVYDDQLQLIAGNNDKISGGPFSEITIGLPAGTYYILVQNFSAYPSAESMGHYYLDIDYCVTCCARESVANLSQINNTTGDFNFGARSVNYTEFITNNLSVSQATLSCNENYPMDFVNANNPLPFPYSHLDVRVCDASTLTIDDGGILRIGHYYTWTSSLIAESGSTVVLKSGSKMIIKDNSKLHIMSGANLVIEPGAEIELINPLSRLEIDGNLIIQSGATFSFTGPGSIIWGNSIPGANVTCGSNSSISLQGTGTSQTILTLKPNSHIQPAIQLANFQLEDGAIRLGNGASISTSDAAYVLDNLDIALDGTTGQHNGIYVNGQADQLLRDVEVSGGSRGITAYQMWNQGATLRLDNCEFHDCEIGLKVHTRGVRMTECDFHDNFIGYQQEVGSTFSLVQMCDFTGNYRGIDFKSGGGDLYFWESSADENAYGIQFSGPGSLYSKCGTTSNNSETGIALAFGAKLRLSDVLYRTGSQHVSTNNKYSVTSVFSSILDFYEGHNNFVPAQQNANHDVYGYMAIPNTGTANLKSHYNHWNTVGSSTGTGPTYNVDYLLVNPYQNAWYPVYLDDFHQISAPYCTYVPSAGGGSGSSLRSCPSCGEITTVHYDKVRLDSAIRHAITKLEVVDSNQNDQLALSLLNEIYGAIPESPNAEESYLQALVYDLAKTAFNGACASGKISTLGEVNSISTDPSIVEMQEIISKVPTSDDLAAFLTNLDQTLFTHTEGFLDTTLIQMDSLLQVAVSGFQSYLAYVDCYVQAENEVMLGLASVEDFEALVQTCNGNKWQENGLLTDGSLERFAASLQDVMALQAYPSPMGESVWIDVDSPKGFAPNITIWDAQGRMLQLPMAQEIGTERFYRIRMTTGALSSGMYVVRVDAGGQVMTRKVVKE